MASGFTTVHLQRSAERFLEKRGARSDRGRTSRFGRSSVLARELEILDLLLERSDPVRRGLPKAIRDLAISSLTEPWDLKADQVDHLEVTLAGLPLFAAAVAGAGLDQQAVLREVAALSLAEKYHLVDRATLAHAPAAASAVPEP
ncbi:MAG: hypothetical protein M3O15_03890 [Acidobacteriota bacterium]|nr:hypothetical protein [Acidobacteriota bacterium]